MDTQALSDIVAAIHQRLKGTVLGDFYERRAELIGGKRWKSELFKVIKDDYAYHYGGRSELQFNIGFEPGDYFRYGVAFSLSPDRNHPRPLDELAPKMRAFNALLPQFPELQRLKMWSWADHARSGEDDVGPIPDSLFTHGVFIFVGEREPAATGVTSAMLDRAAAVLVSLFPLYAAIESTRVDSPASKPAPARTTTASTPATYVARLAYNSRHWQRPASASEVQEADNTYRSENGFGHEDWLFRNEWLLDGWRYGFVQGVNKSREKLLREDRPFNLRLFTMPASGDRRAVAEIRDVECLDDEAAASVVAAYEELGWLDTMRTEVAAAGGRPQALEETSYAPHILNLRYRIENVHPLDGNIPLPADDPIQRIKRYQLSRVDGAMDSARSAWRGRAGTTTLPDTKERHRIMQGGRITYTPEHVRIQQALLDRLRFMFPELEPICEQDFVDVMLRTQKEVILFEVKSDLNPLSVVRQALGQVMEYAFHPRRVHDLPVRLVIVGRRDLEADDRAYFETIRERFSLPVEYWSVRV